MDWGGGDDKNSGESSSDYIRHPHDSVSKECKLARQYYPKFDRTILRYSVARRKKCVRSKLRAC